MKVVLGSKKATWMFSPQSITLHWMTRSIINNQKCFVGEIILGTVFRYERRRIIADVVREDLLRNPGKQLEINSYSSLLSPRIL
jgi:hypothetical protein